MKHWLRSTLGKVTCYILCFLMLGITILTVIGAVALAELGFYTHSETYLIEDTQYLLLSSDVDNIVDSVVSSHYRSQDSYLYSADATNIRFLIAGDKGETIEKNLTGPVDRFDEIWKYQFRHIDSSTGTVYLFYAYLEEGLPVQDEYAFYTGLIHIGYALRYWIYPIGILALILSILCFAMLICSAARKPHSENLYPGPLHRVPFDLLLVLTCGVFVCYFALAEEVYYYDSFMEEIVLMAGLVILTVGVLFGLSMSLTVRIKSRTLLKNTILYRSGILLWKLLKKLSKLLKDVGQKLLMLIRNLSLIWRTLLLVGFLILVDFFIVVFAFEGRDITVFLWIWKTAILAIAALYAALFMRKLQQGGNALAKGDLHYQIDTSMMFWDFKQHGENLNSIAGGMTAAVEERLRSERMKTELITNVSHDIKTPLTSIINYATLISEVACGCEKHKEYSEVLVRKSEHLRRLLDDLVEVSKASTGNLEMALSPCEAGVLLTQAAGEFEQRCQAANLTLITTQPEKPIKILADSRRIWRVFENLMSNACKYSLPGSRVFLSLEESGSEAVFTFRNTSNTVLNLSADELMERFVRGDSSRSTEGNGLGLSIARSLTGLQNGKMDISIDGDLFKVTLRFPII